MKGGYLFSITDSDSRNFSTSALNVRPSSPPHLISALLPLSELSLSSSCFFLAVINLHHPHLAHFLNLNLAPGRWHPFIPAAPLLHAPCPLQMHPLRHQTFPFQIHSSFPIKEFPLLLPHLNGPSPFSFSRFL